MSLLGTHIGRIRLVDRLGKGGMGEVFVGYDQTLDRRVAVKCVQVTGRPRKIKGRFLQEARILSRLDHPNICQIYDFVESEDRDFLVMELVEGISLKQAGETGLDEKTKLKIAQDVADVLVAAHAEGVVHRDLKPEHVMITPEGEVKVLDFGIAHSIDPQAIDSSLDATVDLSSGSPEASPLPPAYKTVAGSVVGTPSYMSPEQARGEPVTPASDMYTFGLLLQELFTGERPLRRQPMEALLVDAAEGRSRPVVGLGRALSELIERLKDLKPNQRPTAKETADRIRWIRETPMRWLRRGLAVAAVLVVAIGGVKYTVDLQREQTAAITARDQAEDLVAFMLEDVSEELRPVGKLEILEQVARKALDYYEQAATGTEGEAASRRASAFAIVAEVLEEQGDFDEAAVAATTARDIHQDLVDTWPEQSQWQNQLALSHSQLAMILRHLGSDRRAETRQSLDTAYAVASRLAQSDPNRAEWRQTLAEVHYAFGLFYLFNVDDAFAAKEAFARAIAIYQDLAAEDPKRLHYKFRLAVMYGQGLGQSFERLDQPAESLAAIEQAYGCYQDLIRADPSNSRWQHGFAWENRRLAEHLEELGRQPEALERYREALAITERLLKLEPSNIEWQIGLANDHSAIASLHEQQGDLESALASSFHATEHWERLSAGAPEDDDLRQWLASDLWTRGLVLRRLGRRSEADAIWERIATLLTPEAQAPDGVESTLLEGYALAVLRLGRPEDARPVVERLRARGWFEDSVDAELVDFCRDLGC